MTAKELNSIVGTPEDISTFDSNQAWSDSGDMVLDSLWLHEPAWEWPQPVSDMPVTEPEPSSLRPTILPSIRNSIEANFVLDSALQSSASQSRSPTSMPPNNLYDDISWSSNFDSIPVGPTKNTYITRPSSDTRRLARSPTSTTSTPALVGEAARIAQEATIEELVTSTSPASNQFFTKWFWQSMSAKIELTFNLIPPRDSNILDHFHDLFHRFFRVTFLKPRHMEVCPPHLYLMKCAIGAAYTGPKAEGFHSALMEAQRGKLVDVALCQTLTDGETFGLIQSLTLLQTAMLAFGDRKALEIALGVMDLIVSLGRRIRLFEEAAQSSDAYKRLASGIVKLDVVVTCLFGTQTSLTEEEKDIKVPQGGEEVLDRLVHKATVTAKANPDTYPRCPGYTGRRAISTKRLFSELL